MLKMDIEEEDPTDSPNCNERDGDDLPTCSLPGRQAEECEWDYLQVATPSTLISAKKLCNFVEKDDEYFVGQKGYESDQYFYEYTYDDGHRVVDDGWYKGKVFDSNILQINFAADNLGHFYGFKLSWKVYNPCKTDFRPNGCHEYATCDEKHSSQEFHCKCSDGFMGDGYDCKAKFKMNQDSDQASSRPMHGFTTVQEDFEEYNNSSNSDSMKEIFINFGPGFSDNSKAKISNYYVALEDTLQRKTKEIISYRVSLNTKKPSLTAHITKRISNAIYKSFFYVIRRCDVSLEDQTSGKYFKKTLEFVANGEVIDDLIKGFNMFTKERYSKPRCLARQRKLSGKVTRYLKWSKKITSKSG